MLSYRFLIDSNTFRMDSGTSKILSKYVPVALPITTKLLQKIQRNMGTSLGNMDLGYLRIWKSQNFRKSCVPNLNICLFVFFVFDFSILEYDNMRKSWKVEDEESPGINFAGGMSWKAWIWVSFRSKRMKRKCGKSNQVFYFWAK